MASSEEVSASRSGPAKTPKRVAPPPSAATDALVVVTLKVSDGSIQTIEAVDSAGARHQLTGAEANKLLAERPKSTIEGLVQQAFEAGIACVLDDGTVEPAGDEASGESHDEALLHDELLEALIAHSPARRLLQRDVLNSALLGTIISGASAGARVAAG